MKEIDINKVTAEVIKELAKDAAKTVGSKLGKLYKDFTNKEEVDYRTAFEKYLLEAQKTVGVAKTILYGQIPHDLYTFFECIGIRNIDGEIDTSDVNNILNIGHKIIITGSGGIGKSMLIKHCFMNAIRNTNLIPILIELRGLNEYEKNNVSMEKYIYDVLCNFGFKLEQKYFEYSLETGCYLILFDGYDEVKNSLSQTVTNEITDFCNKYSDNFTIMSSRPLNEFIGWSDFIEYESMPLKKEQALSLVSKLDYDEEIKGKFRKQLDEDLYEKYESFASNPLLLTIMLMTFEERISIPDRKTDFYEQAFAALFHKHDAMKKGKYRREKMSGLGYEDFKKVFSYFCFKTFFKNEFEFSEKTVLENIERAKEKVLPYEEFKSIDYLDDMSKAVCMLVHEGLNYRFSHRSFQEYFAAVYTTQLSDNEQKQFLTSWLKSLNGRMTSDFLDILCELQPDRCFKNIIYEPMKELYKLYKQNDFSDDWFIDFLYMGVGIREICNKKRIIVFIKQSYYHTVFVSGLRCMHYTFNDMEEPTEYYDTINLLIEKYGEKANDLISFQQLKNDDIYVIVITAISWLIKRKDFMFEKLEEVDINTFGRKRKFESMLEEL